MSKNEINLGAAVVPQQLAGSEVDAKKEKKFPSAAEASSFYQIVKNRLSDVNGWGKIASLPMSSFKLFDYAGRAVDRPAQEGDFIRIDIPGPGTSNGKGYDWVFVEAIVEESEADQNAFSIRVRPAPHPLSEDERTAHFLESTATSTFQIKQKGMTVCAEEHGRNEKSNLNTGHLLDNIRNAVVSVAAKAGLSYPQWKSLVNGLMSPDNKD